MGSEAVRHAAVMLAAGIGIPVLAALNAQLGSRIGSPVAAGVVLFCVALLGAVTVMSSHSATTKSLAKGKLLISAPKAPFPGMPQGAVDIYSGYDRSLIR